MSAPAKHLLVIYHSRSGTNLQLVEAIKRGVSSEPFELDLEIRSAFEADADDLLWADATIFVSPEHFGYMAGALKDFF